MSTAELWIDSLAYRGYGVGRVEGRVWFVPLTAPGDRVAARVLREKKHFVMGELEEVLNPSQDRREAPCPFFGICGGCHWQFLPYPLQLSAKEAILRQTLKKAGCSVPEPLEVRPSPREWQYRSRIQVRFTKEGQPGFYRRESRQVVPVDRCLIARDELNRELALLTGEDPASRKGIPGWELRLAPDGSVQRTPLSGTAEEPGEDPDGDIRTGGMDPRDFSQVNPEINEILRREVRTVLNRWAGKTGLLSLMDLFCGDGNLSLPSADLCGRIRGWDASPAATDRGNRLADEQGAGDVLYIPRTLEADRKAILREARKSDALILDPPRRGLKGLEEFVIGLGIPRILYVSCSPPSLARDLNLLNRAGWRTSGMVMLDMFPQTYHLETLAVLEKTG